MNKLIVGLVVILVVIVGAFFLMSGSDSSSNDVSGSVDESPIKGELKTFVLGGENFKFTMNGNDNPEIKVNEGDRVRIEFTSTKGFHDWVVDEFDASTEKVNDGGSTFVEFTADKKGTFEYYCSVGQHRANGMKGVFVVE
jgi:plastocyanin